jgi:hypothetical protein
VANQVDSNRHGFAMVCLVVWATMAGAAVATPITFELSTYGRLESGPLVVDSLTIRLTYSFDPNLPDVEPSSASGSYASPLAALLQIGAESAQNHDGVGLFTGFNAVPQTYTVGAVYSRGSAYFLGREFLVGVFNLIDFDIKMLVSDALPSNPAFALEAEKSATALTFFPIPGDPAYGGPGYTQFNVCDPSYVDDCVHAPLTLRQISEVPEPTPLALLSVACAVPLLRRVSHAGRRLLGRSRRSSRILSRNQTWVGASSPLNKVAS